jgi:putative transposase
MRKSKYTEEQIAYALRQAEHGTSVAELCRKMGGSQEMGEGRDPRRPGTCGTPEFI